jgi:hypothetical protein
MKGQPQASKLGPAYFAHGCFTTIFERAGKFRLNRTVPLVVFQTAFFSVDVG